MRVLVLAMAALLAATSVQAQNARPQPTDKFVTVNGLKIHYLDWGNPTKPPMLLFHGIGRVGHTFDHIAPNFAADYHILAIDMRGHGDSDWDPKANYLVEDYVKDVEGLVRQLGLKNLTLWGNSTGGRVVQVYAGLHPDLVRALIVEDVGPERPKSVADNFSRVVNAEPEGFASEDELVARLRKSNEGTSEEILRTYARYGTKRAADGRLVWKRDPNIQKGFVETELWQYVRRVKAPTIYIIGGRSTIVPAEAQEQIKKTIPGVEVITMPGLGHYPSNEKPAEFTTIVKKFLARAR